MTDNRGMKIALWTLSCALVLTLIWSSALLVKNYFWKREVTYYAGSAATLEANQLFREGELWLYELDGSSDETGFTGRMEGPFKVYKAWYTPQIGDAHRFARKTYVDAFNEQMRRMQADAERAARTADKRRERNETNIQLPAKPVSPR